MRRRKANEIYTLCKIVKRLKPEEQRLLVSYLNEKGLMAIAECVRQVVFNENIPAKTKAKLRKQFSRKQMMLFDIASPYSDKFKMEKTKKLIQKGGSLSLILGAVLPILADIVYKQLSKK